MTKSNELLVSLAFIAIAVLLFMPRGCGAPGGFVVGLNRWLKVTVEPKPVVVIATPKTKCLIFGFDSCPGCKTLHRTTNQMSRDGWRVGPALTDDIEHIDIKGRDERITKYRHSSYPTLIIVDQSGKELARKEGALSAEVLAEWIRLTRK